MRLQNKLILLICSLLFLILVITGYIVQQMESTELKEQVGARALAVAQSVASMPEIRDAFDDQNPSKTIQPLVEEIRRKTDAEFIVVGNKDQIRYSHPMPDRIGQEMVGGDNEPVLQGNSIISEAVGSLGPSLRGKTPIFDSKGNVIGIVSVGFMIEDIEQMVMPYRYRIIFLVGATLLIGIIGAILIARSVKRAIFGLEPQEIANSYQEKKAIIESIREGILAINAHGIITMVNRPALNLLGLPPDREIIGEHIVDILPSTRMLEVIRTGNVEYDREMMIGENVVVVNRLPIVNNDRQIIGAVSSFRNKSELYHLTQELSQVKRYAEALRAQTHEFSNKLYMISGLIQLESYQEAIDIISRESDIQQNLVQFLMREVPDPMICGLLIGKFNRAKELKVELEIDKETTFCDVPATVDRNELVTIIGNLIDNAMEAVLVTDNPAKKVKVFMTDLGEDLIVEIEDNGIGIKEAYAEQIFELGFSTKAKHNRGFGLALVKRALEHLHGYITYTKNTSGGTVFTAAIPKKWAITAGRGTVSNGKPIGFTADFRTDH